jgi:putative peptidoglycan lipid II flippase
VAGLVGLGLKVALARYLGPMPGTEGEWGGGLLVPPQLHPIVTAALLLPIYGVLYFAFTAALGLPEARGLFQKVLRRVKR